MRDDMTDWSVYILLCHDTTLYTGIAKHVEARLKTHNLGKGAKYTRYRLPVMLVYEEAGLNHGSALRRESVIKKLSREKKLILIEKSKYLNKNKN